MVYCIYQNFIVFCDFGIDFYILMWGWINMFYVCVDMFDFVVVCFVNVFGLYVIIDSFGFSGMF